MAYKIELTRTIDLGDGTHIAIWHDKRDAMYQCQLVRFTDETQEQYQDVGGKVLHVDDNATDERIKRSFGYGDS